MVCVRRIAVFALSALATACAVTGERGTLAQLHRVKVEIKEEKIEGGIEKAIQGYERFIAESGESPRVAEAMRRLADLKVEKEYGIIAPAPASAERAAGAAIEQPARFEAPKAGLAPGAASAGKGKTGVAAGAPSESERAFEERATTSAPISGAPGDAGGAPLAAGADLERAGAQQAIALYKQILAKYPNYDRKDQVLYHMSRAYEEQGKLEEAMDVMNRLIREHPDSKFFDEVQFRRGEYFFTRKKFLDAEDAYKAIVSRGTGSFFYELAVYKYGWTFYKQELYEEALPQFVALLDYKLATGYDFENSTDDLEKKRVEDTYRVISLSFSSSGGSATVAEFFDRHGARPYEVNIYDNLGGFYLDKRRYNDAAVTYKTFVNRNPFHKVAPYFDMKVIDTYRKGGFPKLVIDSTKDFARSYGLKSEYWKRYDPKSQPEVVGFLKQNLTDLANHYHALYQDKRFEKSKSESYREALIWYREFLSSFPQAAETPGMNYQLADLLLENKAYGDAAKEYERTAYNYPTHEKSAAAGYAAVYAHREALKLVEPATLETVREDVIRSSLKFADAFPTHEKAAVVLGAAADDLYEMKDYERGMAAARKLIARYPQAEQDIRRAAWLVIAHGSLELGKFEDAEQGYVTVLSLTKENDQSRAAVTENLAASIYKQGEQASKRKDYNAAANHFLRIAQAAPTSKIRPAAQYDAVAALFELKEWDRAVQVLDAFRKNYPQHELQPEVTKKMALAHKEAGRSALAAAEYERVEKEGKEEDLRRGALALAAELYEEAERFDDALRVYRRYVDQFPRPLELALETRYKIAKLYKSRNDIASYFRESKLIVESDARAGAERTDRTRYLAAVSALALTEPHYEQFLTIKLVKPFKKNLARKKEAMKQATEAFGKLVDYKAGEVTAASAFYIAEIYYQFGRALAGSERPDDLSAVELEQYELALEDQVFRFEEKAIALHEKNLELLGVGVYNDWLDRSIQKLAKLVPARYARAEQSTGFIEKLGPFRYQLARQSVPNSSDVPHKVDSGSARSEQAVEEGQATEPPKQESADVQAR